MNPSATPSPLWKQAVWMRPKDQGDLLGAFIKSSGNTCGTLAIKVGCTRQMISALKRGEKSCSPDLAHKIAAALDIPVDIIFLTKPSRIPLPPTANGRQKRAA